MTGVKTESEDHAADQLHPSTFFPAMFALLIVLAIFDNRSGGGMNIAGRACADAPNDGYTICILPNETLTLNQFTYKSIPFDPEKDFEPITNAFINTQVLVVSAGLGVSSLDELAA